VQAYEVINVLCTPNAATAFTAPSGYASVSTNGNSYLLTEAIVTAIQTGIAPTTSYSPTNNETSLIVSFKANTPAAGTAVLSSSNLSCAVVNGNAIQAQSVISQCTSTITATVGVVTGTTTLTVNPVTPTDTSIIIVPNPSNSITVGVTGACPNPAGTSNCYKAIGNVTGQGYTGTWGSSNTAVATVNPTTGVQTLANCLAPGTVNISVTVSGFTSYTPSTLNCVSTGSGTVIPLSDCSPTTLSNQWGTMSSGAYIIKFPNCSGTSTAANGLWTSGVNLSVPANVTSVTIQGNTTVNCTGTPGQSTYTCVPTDTTILTDQYAVSGATLFTINTGGASTSVRITGMTFQGGNTGGVGKYNGFMTFNGSSQNLRVDHNHLNTKTYDTNNGGGAQHNGYVYGVWDHNRFDLNTPNNGVRSYNNTGDGGNQPWSEATNLGSSLFLFIELNEFNGGFVNDCNYGARQVARYNMVRANSNDGTANSGVIQTHVNAQGDPNSRGCRALENYHNYHMNPTTSFPMYASADGSAATGVAYGNTVAAGINNDIGFLYLGRVLAGNNCGQGANTANGCPVPPGGPGYCGTGSTGIFSVWDGNSNSAGYPCLGQTGRGKGDLLTGAYPSRRNSTTSCVPTSPPGCSVWAHDLREPWYVWNETITGHPVCFSVNYSGVVMTADRDYYCQVSPNPNTSTTSPFNGTTGTGFGPGQYRPLTCTAGPGGTYDTSPMGSYGVAYFTTDSTGGLAVNTLYVCTALNTWTAIYTPYTYPHPLDTGP
jgi:hypothetical protein